MIRVAARHAFGAFRLEVDFRSDEPVLALFGPSGAGKSTVLRIVAGLLRADAAEVEVAGRTLCSSAAQLFLPPEHRAVGYVAQEPFLFPHLSVAKNLSFGSRRARENGTGISRAKVLQVLEIEPLLDRSVRNLSGGEARRVALGRALLSGPRLLLLDEPLAGLDAGLRLRIVPMLQRVFEEFGVPALLVSHSRAEVLQLARGIVVLDRGRQVHSGGAAEVLNEAEVLSLSGEAGLENLIEGTVLASDAVGGVTTLELVRGGRLVIPLVEAQPGDRLHVAVRAEDIIIATRRPECLSVRSLLSGTVTARREARGGCFVEVDAGAPLVALVTPAAAAELGLAPGVAVFLLVKAHAVRRVG
ncbi:MAG: molybdenum ABC transporter ATP-binding protein [Planctomycetes bacterium]|nr:molybdenum ABC transporter ATP-binding protein [Planctomycetota bacterium]